MADKRYSTLKKLVDFIDDRLRAADLPNAPFATRVGMSPSSFTQIMNRGQKTVGLTNLRKIAIGLRDLTGESITAEQLQSMIGDPTELDAIERKSSEPEILRSSCVVWHLERMTIEDRIKTFLKTTPMLIADLALLSPVPMGEFPIVRYALMEKLIDRIHKLAKTAKTETIEEFANWLIEMHPDEKKNDRIALVKGLFRITALKTLPYQSAESYQALILLAHAMELEDDLELLDQCGLKPDSSIESTL